MNAFIKEALPVTTAEDVAGRVKAFDWERVPEDLDAQGRAIIENLVSPEECAALAALYPADGIFRNRIVMGRLGFGRGEYQYFTCGEFVLTEQRPRMQSRPEIVPFMQGNAVVFAVHHRPVQRTRGVYRVNIRHGVSHLRSGHRHTVGIIFHDAA